ncbi:isoleucine--tRNA ligase [Candidatus Magnetaquicoccus inordinatus]|uniref:isoleucine--tRNA ligase n=1 Tax=Candidatus Magnetaquicoccus inordinatus TaxID=2496818 RepID=UPI00102AD6FB|nr:isoleucine--tRNA ligase [Candidatus Magnetaquicoccus inordinatus]
MDYKNSVQLPLTDFPMRANLPQMEPAILQKWLTDDLYQQLRRQAQSKPLFTLHDGPPYANGHLHMGHAINKVLKDVIVKAKQMSGFNANFIPGWDCHGLPIETNVEQELKKQGRNKDDLPIQEFRRLCRGYAEKWVNTQREEFKRLGVIANWDNPYLTMSYRFEADIVRELGRFLANGSLYKGVKPVYWCIHDVTALAEAEVEYQDHTSQSIYVAFPLAEAATLPMQAALPDNLPISILIWTTTPWTIPANLAVALHPQLRYVAVHIQSAALPPTLQNGAIFLLAEGLLESTLASLGIPAEETRILASCNGSDLEGIRFRHPYLEQDAPILLADYVTLEAGTGCVHTAPAHGHEDFASGQRYGLTPFNPVDDHGRFHADTPHFAGMPIFKANQAVIELLREKGRLLAHRPLTHSYPHCWRCHKPIVIRTTPQWFISMESNQLREQALAAIRATQWIPAWGEDRIRNMIAVRPDWCVSRQRTWGVPITIISCAHCHTRLTDSASIETIAQQVEQHSADIWFNQEASAFLPDGFQCPQCASTEFQKEKDILDVWFDSGVTHAAVLERGVQEGLPLSWPADLYLEGSDQHRGWFHSSLLAAIGTRQQAPYKAVLTHGFVVDGQGRKMSKSLGNVIAPDKVIQQYGADILRLWVTAEDYSGDIRLSDEILKGLSDAYRRIRNTLRFLLGNLHDFIPAQHAVAVEQLPELDRWALDRLAQLIQQVETAYESFAFHRVYQDLHYFCSVDLGAFYLDILKDRLYCDGKNWLSRRAAQTVLHHILESLVRLIAPILSFTAEEIWSFMANPGDQGDTPRAASVHLTSFPQVDPLWRNRQREADWEQLRQVRAALYRILEQERLGKRIGTFMEVEVTLYAQPELFTILHSFTDLARLLIVSQVKLLTSQEAPAEALPCSDLPALQLTFRRSSGQKCIRCWNWSDLSQKEIPEGSPDPHPELCPRCHAAVEELLANSAEA